MYWTDIGENAYADKMRGTAPTLPTNWYLAFGTVASDGAFTEIVDVSMPRISVARSLANWAGTQAGGSTLASSGTSHQTSNNIALTWAAPTSDLGTAKYVALFSALTGGSRWAYAPISDLPILNGVAPTLGIGTLAFIMGGQGVSDFLSNKLIDEFFRGQVYSWPATMYGGLFTAAPTNAGGGTEVGGIGGYTRVSLASSMAAISGTQSAGSTSASSGTNGIISNNATLSYPTPSAPLGDIVAEGWFDASSGGNLLLWGELSPRTILTGTPITHAPGSLRFKLTK